MFSKRFTSLELALYCASIIIGAGLLTLPLAAARLGFGPLIAGIVLGAFYMAVVSRRTAESLYGYIKEKSRRMAAVVTAGLKAAGGTACDPKSPLANVAAITRDEVSRRGSRQLPDLAAEAGLGAAGRWCILLGMFLYVFFADVGYLLIGSRSLRALAMYAEEVGPSLPPALALGGSALLLIAWQIERLLKRPFLLRGTLKKVMMMAGAWLIGIAMLGYVNATAPTLTNIVGIALFVSAVLAGMYTKLISGGPVRTGTLNDQHTVNVVVTVGEIILLILCMAAILVTVTRHQMLVPFYGLADDGLSLKTLGAWSNLIGLIIFAFVGTGLFNLLSYPTLFEAPDARRSSRLAQVVMLGTVIPMLVYLAWTATSAATLTPGELAAADSAKETVNIVIARKFAPVAPFAALLITLSGYSVALLAVTSACNGFTESLADQIAAAQRAAGRGKGGDRENKQLRLQILIAAAAMAIAIDYLAQIDISSILAVAGNAGGGLLVLILPFFLPPPGKHKTTWSSVMVGLMTAVVLTLLSMTAINISAVHDIASGLVATITVMIALSIIGVAIWLIRSEPSQLDDNAGG